VITQYGIGWMMILFGLWFWFLALGSNQSERAQPTIEFLTTIGFVTVGLGVWMFPIEWYFRSQGVWPM
jgi:hypothetical protein